MKSMDKVLIVDGDLEFSNTLKVGLQKYEGQFEAVTASDREEALEVLKKARISVMIIDLVMSETDGQGLLTHMKKNRPQVPCIAMIARGRPEIKNATDPGIFHFIEKPFEFSELANVIIDGLDRIDEGVFWKEYRK
jgi:DNA-binding NtrC family response regulator